MTLDIYQVDAFATAIFSGNPAAVIPLDNWLDDQILQSIALENNLSETAYIIRTKSGYNIRWFTPTEEVDLCGHATLAAAKIIYDELDYEGDKITFDSKSGPLYVTKRGAKIELDFPTDTIKPASEASDTITKALGLEPQSVWIGKSDYLCILEREEQIRSVKPDFRLLMNLKARGLLVSALADSASPYDVVSRGFFPQFGIDEDPVTGSAHTTIIPYWAGQLGRTTIEAYQASYRGGQLSCEYKVDRVSLAGEAYLYMKGKIFI